jgi:CAAX protease family protein
MRGRDAGFATAVAGLLAAYNNTGGERPCRQRWYPVTNLGAAGLLLAAATASGLTAADLGLTARRVPAGLRRAAGPAGALAAGWLTLAAMPASRPVLADQRITGLTWRQVAYQVTVRIPVGTVLWEEIAFRGVLDAALRRVLPGPAALAVSSGVFGIWHIRPTIAALRINQVGTGGRADWARVAAAVLGMAAAGGFLSGFRRYSGTLAAPALLHLTANSGAALAARAVAGTR